jgi:rare lipoprotein A
MSTLILPLTASAAEFSDLGPTHIYYEHIIQLNEDGCLSGYEDGSMKPDQTINRVETLKLLQTCIDLPGVYQEETFTIPEGGSYFVDDKETKVYRDTEVKLRVPVDFESQPDLGFDDTEEETWYTPILKEALIRDLVTGYADNTIKPLKPINKAEFYTMLYRLVPESLQNADVSGQIATDVPNDSWYAEGMAFALQNELITKNEDGSVNALKELNRGHVAFFLAEYVNWLDAKLNPVEETTEDENTEDTTNETDTTEDDTTTDETSNDDTTTDQTSTEDDDDTEYEIGYSESGIASYYSATLEGAKTASGELHSPTSLVAAHKEFPFGTIVKVTNTDNEKWVKVRINDRGPYAEGRVIDLSYSAFESIAEPSSGLANVIIEIVEE